jgi:hypothetical protein
MREGPVPERAPSFLLTHRITVDLGAGLAVASSLLGESAAI